MDHELYRRSTIGMCLMEIGFMCAVGFLLYCGSSSSSLFLSSRFPSFFFSFFFFLVSFFLWVISSFSGFSTFFVLYLKSSVKNSRFMFFWTRLLKTRDLCGINMSNSASGKRVFEARDWYGTRVSKTRDASLQFSFKPVLTYYILSLHNVSLQISPRKHLLRLFFYFFYQTFPKTLRVRKQWL